VRAAFGYLFEKPPSPGLSRMLPPIACRDWEIASQKLGASAEFDYRSDCLTDSTFSPQLLIMKELLDE
jgi:hypothetical protein